MYKKFLRMEKKEKKESIVKKWHDREMDAA
jgi:hypothetical protein